MIKKSTQSWIEAAEEDLLVVTSLIKSEIATGAASFHAQQCVEKCLKAVIEEYKSKVPKVHDLDKLFYETKEYINIEIDELIVDKLNSLYIETRYPGAFGFLPNGKPSIEEVKEFYNFATYIYKIVKTHLDLIGT
jgi:HEPN domain-containing protein